MPAEVVPGPREAAEPAQLRLVFDAKAEPGSTVEVEAKRSSRHPWAWLLRRVFAVEVLTCEQCEGRMRLVSIANEPDDISRVLAKVGLDHRRDGGRRCPVSSNWNLPPDPRKPRGPCRGGSWSSWGKRSSQT